VSLMSTYAPPSLLLYPMAPCNSAYM
jgi:hypothetical protein